MKKHAGKFVAAGMLILVFGLIIMAGVFLVSDMVIGANRTCPEVLEGTLSAAGEASWALLGFGGLALALGLYMHTGSD